MKQLAITFVLFLTLSTAFGQNKYQERQIKYFVDASTKEYSLSADQAKELTDARVELVKSYAELSSGVKDGTISEDAKKEKNKQIAQTFQTVMSKVTGKTYKELEPFYNKMREELKSVK